MNFSFWEQQTFFKDIDFAVIGSGVVGLNAAIALKSNQPNAKVVVFERGLLPSGASTKNAGFACFGSVSELLENLKTYSENEVFSLVERRYKGLQKLRSILGDADMDFQHNGGHEVFIDEDLYQKCEDAIPYFNKNLASIVGKDVFSSADSHIESLGFQGVKHLIFNAYEGQIYTGKTMQALIAHARNLGIEILNGIKIESVEDLHTHSLLHLDANTSIKVKAAVVATNGFAKQLLPELDLAPGRGQVLVTKPIENLKLKGIFHYDAGFFYFRNIGDRILLGGGRNLDFKAEETTEFGLTDLVQNELHRLLEEVIIPNQAYQIETKWSGIMGFGTQQAPIVKKVSDTIFCAVKMQGMGVALGSLVGEEVAELVLA